MNVLELLRSLGRAPATASADDARFLAVTEASAAMVLVVEDDVIRYANRAARASGGGRRGELVDARAPSG